MPPLDDWKPCLMTEMINAGDMTVDVIYAPEDGAEGQVH